MKLLKVVLGSASEPDTSEIGTLHAKLRGMLYRMFALANRTIKWQYVAKIVCLNFLLKYF